MGGETVTAWGILGAVGVGVIVAILIVIVINTRKNRE